MRPANSSTPLMLPYGPGNRELARVSIRVITNMILALARRLVQRAPRQLSQQRGMAGHGDYPPVPKPDRSLDHVFGDNSYKVDFDVRSLGELSSLMTPRFGDAT